MSTRLQPPSAELGKALGDTDVQAARDLFHKMVQGWFEGAEDEEADPVVTLAGRFVAINLENPIFRDANKRSDPKAPRDIPEAIAFAAQIARTMTFERKVIHERAQNLAAIVRGLAAHATLTEPIILLSTLDQDRTTATTTLGVSLETVRLLGADFDGPAGGPVAACDAVWPDGRRGTVTQIPVLGESLQLEINSYHESAVHEQSELELLVAPFKQ